MFWWRHTGPREALLTCSEILKFSQNIYKSSQKYSHPPPSCWWLNSRKSKPQVTTQHFTNEFPRIPRDKWGVNQPSLSIKSQLIIKSCWAGIIRSPAVPSTPGTRHHFPPAQTDVWVRTEEGAESGERSWAARQPPACSARWRTDWGDQNPSPSPTLNSRRALRWKLREEILSVFYFSDSEASLAISAHVVARLSPTKRIICWGQICLLQK